MRKHINAGFSLIEMMLVTLILLTIFVTIFSIFVNNQKAFDAEQANAEANANARFALNRIKEIIESSGNNPGQIGSINDQTGGIVKLFTGTVAYSSGSGLSGSFIYPFIGTSNCNPAVANQYCGTAVDLLSDLNGNGVTTDDVEASGSGVIFNQNIITSEHLQLYLDQTPLPSGLVSDEVYLINLNKTGTPRTAIAEFVVNMQFMVDVPTSTMTITVTARSNRAVATEGRLERRFRYATLSTKVRIRNMNTNVARVFNTEQNHIDVANVVF
ncbi:MAG: hypothetical protein AB1489_01565 [Acidobacteriota bacterium]